MTQSQWAPTIFEQKVEYDELVEARDRVNRKVTVTIRMLIITVAWFGFQVLLAPDQIMMMDLFLIASWTSTGFLFHTFNSMMDERYKWKKLYDQYNKKWGLESEI